MKLLLFLIFINVKIEYKPMFENNFFIYKIAEKITFKPRKWRVKQLILKSDDTVNIKETLRRIRETGIFTDIEYIKEKDSILIKLRPLFTLALFLNFEGGGGLIQKGIGIWEHNFLGLLWDLRVNYIWGYEYPYFNIISFYPSIFKNHDLSFYFLDSQFSKYIYFSILPYFSTALRNKFYITLFKYDTKKFYYEEGILKDTYNFKEEFYSFEFSRNLKKFPKALYLRLGIFEQNFYYENNLYLKVGTEIGNLKTEITKYIENFGENEFIPGGVYLSLSFYKNLNKNKQGFEFSFNSFKKVNKTNIRFALNYINFIDKTFKTSVTVYHNISTSVIWAFYLKRVKIYKRENDFEFEYLGGLFGLRGYKAFYFKTSDYILNICELRFYLPEILNILKPGFVMFIDNSYLVDRKKQAFSYGFGLRFEITRSYNLPVMRIDIGFSGKEYYISFGEGQSF